MAKMLGWWMDWLDGYRQCHAHRARHHLPGPIFTLWFLVVILHCFIFNLWFHIVWRHKLVAVAVVVVVFCLVWIFLLPQLTTVASGALSISFLSTLDWHCRRTIKGFCTYTKRLCLLIGIEWHFQLGKKGLFFTNTPHISPTSSKHTHTQTTPTEIVQHFYGFYKKWREQCLNCLK